MKPGRRASHSEEHFGHGFGAFLRSLLAGIPWSERAEGEEILHHKAPSSGVLRVHNANGRTCVLAEDRDDVEVRAIKNARAESTEEAERLLEQIRIVCEETGDALEFEVDVPRRWNRRGYANLEMRIPRGLAVDVTASNGKVSIHGVRGQVHTRSSNGSVHIEDVTGDIEIATSNAKVSCSNTCGRLLARSSNGKIELLNHSGSMDASTSNGLIRAALDKVGKEGVQLATSNGRIVLELPADVDAEIDIRVDNGVIRNERELCRSSRASNGQIRGRLGAGGSLIKLRTSNGSISLK